MHMIVQIILFTSLEVSEEDKVKTEAFSRPVAALHQKKKTHFSLNTWLFVRKTEKVTRDRRKTA